MTSAADLITPHASSFPRLEIDVRKLEENTRVEVQRLAEQGVTVMGVNKVFNGMPETAQAIWRGGIQVIAESRVSNLKKLQSVPCAKCLLRTPGPSELPDVIRHADISLQSDIRMLRALSREATHQGKTHRVLLMIDMGDLREGIWFRDEAAIHSTLSELQRLPNLEIYGLGTNFNCLGAIMPTMENGERFVEIARKMEARLGIRFSYLSGGNCTSYHLIDKGTWPAGINHLRIGALHQFGIEYVDMKYLDEYHHSLMPVERATSNLYLLKAEVIEVNTKPTFPVGVQGFDAFLQRPRFADRGERRRALLALGRQDVPAAGCWPIDPEIQVIGQASDHTVVDIHDCEREHGVGDIVSFELDYTALLAACNSPGITKVAVTG
ncbi:MAG: alanine/ornithine racemase family PLP-dependent enzyme [Deltaproteobacteria bacterium]|nr:alanine/ornithine racemase family PLP-dependent enzyme [Deltaproteobacteria bacterium]